MRHILIVATLAILALAAGVAWAIQSGAAAESVRVRLVEETTRALGREVHVDALHGDPWRGIELQGVRLAGPAGSARAFLEAPRVVFSFDARRLVGDLIGGRGVLSSLTRVAIERPVLMLARDQSGRWNYADLLAGRQIAVGAFRAAVDVREGQVIFRDAFRLPQRAGGRGPTPFAAHFERVTGTLDLERAPTLRIALDAVNTDGPTPALLHVSGRATPDEGTFDLGLDARGAAVGVWGPYLVRQPWVVWGGGTADSTMHLLRSRWAGRLVLDFRGQLKMRGGRALLLPSRTLLSAIDGPLAVDNLGVTTSGLTMAADGSPLSVRGRITYHSGAALDLALRSRAVDLRTLQGLFFPRARIRLAGQARGEVRITGPPDSPRMEGEIDRASGSINRQPFADLSGRFQYYGGLLSFEDLAASAGGGILRGHLRLDVRAGQFFVLADARDVDAHVLDGIGLAVPPSFSGAATGVVAAARTPGGLLAQGRLTLGRGSAFGIDFDRAGGVFGYDRGGLVVEHFAASGAAGRLHGSGAMSPTGTLDFAVAGADMDLSAVAGRFGLRRWMEGTADMSGRFLGTLRSPELEAQIRGHDGRLGPLPFDLARGSVRVTRTSLRTPGLFLFDAGARYSAVGLIHWAGPSHVDLTAHAEHVAARRLMEIAEIPLQAGGIVNTTVRITGPVARPMAQGVIELRDGHIEGQPVDRATAAFRWSGTGLLVENLSAGVNGSTLLASGSVSRSGAVGITFSAQALDVSDIVALRRDVLRFSGTADLTGSIRGTLRAPAVSAAATSGNLVVNGQSFDRARGQVSYRGGRLALTPLVLEQAAGTFQVSGTVLLRDDPVVDLRVTASGGELATLLGLSRIRPPIALRGTLDGEVTATGPASNPRAVVDLRLSDGWIGDEPIQEALVRADLADQSVTLETLRVVPAQGELLGAGRISLRGPSDVEFAGAGVDLNLLRPLLRLPRPMRGSLDFTLQLTGELNDPLVGLSAAVGEGGVGPLSFDRLTVQAFYRAGQFNIEHGVLQEDRHRVRVAGSLPFNPARMRWDEARPLDLRVDLVDSDLGLLTLFSDRIERAEGGLAGTVSIAGTAARPRLEGQLTASGGILKLRGLEPTLTDVQARITFAEDTLRIDGLRARAGEGTVDVGGTVGFRRFRPEQLNLTLASDGAVVNLPGMFAGRVDGAVRVTGSMTRPEIGGTATLSQGDIHVAAAQRTIARPANGPSGPALDLEVRAGSALWVNVGGLRFQVGGALRTLGNVRTPRLSGEVIAQRGSFVAFNTTFRLLEGRATFSEFRGMTPFVDALAETRVTIQRKLLDGRVVVERPVVRLRVTGTPDALDLQLTSDPPVPRSELMAALGRRSGFAVIFTAGADLERALLNELSNALFGQVGRAVAGVLGLEEFTLEYDAERQLSLRIGTLLIENLYLTWTSEFVTPPRTVWALEYRLSPSTRISFSVDNSARYNFLYRVTYAF